MYLAGKCYHSTMVTKNIPYSFVIFYSYFYQTKQWLFAILDEYS